MKGHHDVLFTPSFGSLLATAPRATKLTMNKIFNGGHYIPNWNFMLKTRMMLIDTCQPRISLLCSSSSYKIFNVKNIIFQIGILCQRQKNDDKLFFWLELFDDYLGLLQETV
jgi:hypothetical protein